MHLSTPRFSARVAPAVLLAAASTAASAGDLFVLDRFGGAGPGAAEAGWVGGWKPSKGATLRPDAAGAAMVGQGRLDRTLSYEVDFGVDAEWWFAVRIDRTRPTGPGSDFATVTLTNGDDDVRGRPLKFGIGSGDEAFADFGGTQNFGPAPFVEPHTLVAHLRTRAEEPDELSVYHFRGGRALPAAPPAEPAGTLSFSYGERAKGLELATGGAPGGAAAFSGLRIGADWESVTSASAEAAADPAATPYRVFKPLRVADDAERPLITQWSSVSLFPRPDGPPRVTVLSGHKWVPEPVIVYEPTADPFAGGRETPLYAPPARFDTLPPERYQVVGGPGGRRDVWDTQDVVRVATLGADGGIRKLDAPEPAGFAAGPRGENRAQILKHTRRRPGTRRWIGDADGDGVPDLILSSMPDPGEQWSYWPRRQTAFTTERQPHVGPHRDVEHTDGFRGYDLNGNWLGSLRTKELSWMRGAWGADGLELAEEKPVFVGRDDFPAQWRNATRGVEPALMDFDGVRHLVLLSNNDVLAAPILDDEPGRLSIGRAVELLAPGEDRGFMVHPNAWAVADMTGDGRDDLVVGSGGAAYLVVLSGTRPGDFRVLPPVSNLGGPVMAGTLVVPHRGDWTGDGLPDLVTGDGGGYYLLWPGTPDPLVYAGATFFQHQAERAGDARGSNPWAPLVFKGEKNLQGPDETGWSYSQPTLADWDGDGRLELLGNENTSTLRLHTRVDGTLPPKVRSAVFTQDGHKLGIAWRSRVGVVPAGAAVGGRRAAALLFPDLDNLLKVGLPRSPGATEIDRVLPVTFTDGEPVQTAGYSGLSGRTHLDVEDWDGDGVWDIVVSVPKRGIEYLDQDEARSRSALALNTSAAFWLRNAGTAAEPTFERPRRITFADGVVMRVEAHGFFSDATDLDGDGELDLIAADGPGFVHYFLRDELRWSD